MRKPNAPYSSARRAANTQVASGGVFDTMKDLVMGKGREKDSMPINQKPANQAANVLRDTSSMGKTAVDNTRKLRNKTADYLNSIGE
jgi:hypothetical protein